jgi:hypothetical protein
MCIGLLGGVSNTKTRSGATSAARPGLSDVILFQNCSADQGFLSATGMDQGFAMYARAIPVGRAGAADWGRWIALELMTWD